jgi:two-component system, chemotaxis family, chemotaxis protein CheY
MPNNALPIDNKRTAATTPRVLVVDDNAVVRLALSGVIRQDLSLTLAGEASNGESALEAIKTFQPDVVCLDIAMPRMDGLATLKHLREADPQLRVIIITARGTAEIVEEARALGADGFIVKPFNADRVLSTIHSVLRSSK